MRVSKAQNYQEERNAIAFEYISFFESLGYVIILIPNNSNNIHMYFKQDIDLIVLTGGNNINPTLYNSHDVLNDVYDCRDRTETKLLDYAIAKNIKVLGICRGFHFINVYFGGSLSHAVPNHVNIFHKITSNNQIINEQKTNSFHNQAVFEKDLSNKLEILAKYDNVIEAIINKEKTILGIQWHPERENQEFDMELIQKFTEGKL